jgi:hypothetical protein
MLQYQCGFNIKNIVHWYCNTGIAPDPIPKRVGSAEVISCVLDDLQMCKPVSQQCFSRWRHVCGVGVGSTLVDTGHMTTPWVGRVPFITRAHECDYAFQKKMWHWAMDFILYH